MLNLSSPGLYAMDTSKDEAKGTTMGMLEISGRAVIRSVLHLPSLNSYKMRERWLCTCLRSSSA